jgi:hypothetical protein
VDNTQKAFSILEQNKIPHTTDEVLVFELTSKPGQTAQISRK